MLEILKDLGRIEDLQVAVDQDRDLALGIYPQDIRMLGLIAQLRIVRDHEDLGRQALLQGGDLGFRPEHAQGTGIEAHDHLPRTIAGTYQEPTVPGRQPVASG
jgi:hypothetical protein